MDFEKDLRVEETNVPGLLVFDLPVHGDNRGWFKENWQRAKMCALGVPDIRMVQNNVSFNAERGVTRGVHAEPWDKWISVATGRIFGAWVDLREGSATYGKSFSCEVAPSRAIFTPRGVGNSFQALEDGTAYTYLVRLKVLLDKQNVPTQGRWVLVPPEYHGLLLQHNRFVGTGGAKAEDTLGNGLVGRAAGFEVYLSNNLPCTLGKYKVLASYNGATSYAEQILSTEAYRMEKRFADAVKGLHVYGAKVTRPDKIAVLTASFDSGLLEPLTLTSAAGSATGKTKVTVSPAVPAGYTAKYKTAAAVQIPQYDAVLTTGWSAFTANADITAATGNEIAVAYVDGSNKAKAAGKTAVTAAE